MKYLAVLLIIVAAVAAGKRYFNKTGERISTEMTTALTPAPEDARMHFTATDLVKVGCRVAPELGKYSQVDMPFIGLVKTYGLRSDAGCRLVLSSQLSQMNLGADGMWAGVRAAASGTARKQGYEVETEEGSLGEYSEIHHFTQNGQAKGFIYAVESKGVLHSITILSEDIQLDEKLEAVIAEKL